MIDRIAKLIHRNILFVQETTQSMSQKMEAASEATAVAIEQNEMEANGVDHETSSDAESEHAAELAISTKDPIDEDREMDIKKEDLLKVSSFHKLQDTGGSVDEVYRNRAQAPVSKYLFGLISNVINCTDTFSTFFGPGKLSQ